MRFAAIFLVLAVDTWASAGGLADATAATSDQDRLQGLWLMYCLLPGQTLPAHPGDGGPLRISGNRVRPIEQGKKSKDAPQEVSFTLDPRQNPKTIDIHRSEHGKKITWKGIYTLNDEEVRIALAVKAPRPGDTSWGPGERPASFDGRKAPKDTLVLVLVLKRAKGELPAAKKDAKMRAPPSIAFNGFGAVALSPDGKCLAASGAPGTTVRLWDTVTGKETGALRGHDSEVRVAVFSRDGKRLFTATTTEVRIWEVPTGKQLQRIPAGPQRGCDRLTLSGDEKWFVSDPETEPKIAPDGRFVVSTIRLWEVGTGKEVRRFAIARTTAQIVGQYLDYFARGKGSDAIVGTALSHDGKWVVAGTERGEVHLWNDATGKKVRTFGGWNDIGAIPVGFSGNGKWLVTSSLTLFGTKCRGVIRVWDVTTGKEKHAIEEYVFDPSLPVRNVFGPSLTDDGKWLIGVTGAEESTVRIWEVETGKEVRAFAGYKKAVTHCWVSRDKKLLATYDRGGSVRLWDVATGKELRVIEVRTRPDRLWPSENFQVRFSKHAKLLVTWTPSRLTLWDLEKGRAIRSMRR
jgi:uncharacterized protein (TIGR03067 family)